LYYDRDGEFRGVENGVEFLGDSHGDDSRDDDSEDDDFLRIKWWDAVMPVFSLRGRLMNY
jgi:hypothetical protein